VDSRAQKFMGSWISTIFFLSYYFFKFTSYFFFFRLYILLDCMKDTNTILWPIWNWMRIYGWRLDCPVDPIEIGFMISQTLQLGICRWTIVYWLLVPHNWLQALNLQSTRHLYVNKFKLKQLGFLLRQNDLVLIRPHLCYCTWSCYQTWVVYVVHLVPHPVPIKICIRLLLL